MGAQPAPALRPLGRRAAGHPRTRRSCGSWPGRRWASRLVEATSTPQMIRVTVTCLVHATGNRATVRLSVTRRRAVPGLTHGYGLRRGGRRSPRSTASITPRHHTPDARWGLATPISMTFGNNRLHRPNTATRKLSWLGAYAGRPSPGIVHRNDGSGVRGNRLRAHLNGSWRARPPPSRPCQCGGRAAG